MERPESGVEHLRIPAVYMRGGTSKAVLIRREHIPHDVAVADAAILAAMGSPDPYGRQLDGMGGGASSTSKVAIVEPSAQEGIDVDYEFLQVGIDRPTLGRRGTCGNIASAVALLAVEEGWATVTEGTTTVRIRSVNTGGLILATVPTMNSRALAHGDTAIAGVAGTSAGIRVVFRDPQGAVTGALLPTGSARETWTASESDREVSLVDAGNPLLITARDGLGLEKLMPDALTAATDALETLRVLRARAARACSLVSSEDDADTHSPSIPLVAVVDRPDCYATTSGETVTAESIDIRTTMISSGLPHKASPITGALALAIAVVTPGTIAWDLAGRQDDRERVRIGHPAGVLEVVIDRDDHGAVQGAGFVRTARRLMTGQLEINLRA